MSCYFRHLKDVFDEAGITVTRENRKQVDMAIHRIMDVEYKNCPPAWKKVKQEVFQDSTKRQEFVARLKSELNRSQSSQAG